MLVSFNWLKHYIDVDLPADEMSELLTAIGLEVEGVQQHERIPGGLRGVVVGQVLTCERHPNADRLSVTTVDVGGDQPLHVVCGAPNVAAGQHVAVATVGTTLYDADGQPWSIKKSKIRGERSEGMLCAEDELHIGTSHEGIMTLDGDQVKVGEPLSNHYDTGSDIIFDIGLTPNRSDATCHLGVADDIAAALKIQKGMDVSVKRPSFQHSWVDRPCPVEVEVVAVDACARYSGVVLEGVKVRPSPDWLQQRLLSIGVRPINNVVDITNFILHEMGQPLHAFDFDMIEGSKVIVDRLADGTAFSTLDEVERKLTATDLMICDSRRQPMCIAGVFGGVGSGVTEKTTRIFLESAHFEAVGIRRSSVHHQLRTDAAKIYEKGSDPNVTVEALHRAIDLLGQVAGAQVNGGLVDVYPSVVEPQVVRLRHERLSTITGYEMETSEVEDILSSMQMTFSARADEQAWDVYVPTNKADVTREVDLIEEVMRIYGFDNIPASPQLRYSMQSETGIPPHTTRQRLISRLTQMGYDQMMNMSLTRSSYYEGAALESVRVLNSSNVEYDTMRQDLLHPALEAVSHNHRHQQRDVRVFEIGETYTRGEEEFIEREQLICLISGLRHEAHWQEGAPDTDVFELKSVARMLWPDRAWSRMKWVAMDAGLDLKVGEQTRGRIRSTTPAQMERFELVTPVHYLEIDMKPCIKAWARDAVTMTPILKYPSMTRDLAFVLPKSVSYAEVEAQIHAAKQRRCVHHYLFDLYQDEDRLGADRQSMAIRFVFEDASKTMSDKEVDKMLAKIRHALEQIADLSIRA